MGRTYVNAIVRAAQNEGELTGREYRLLVDTGSTYLGLPVEDIEQLGLMSLGTGRRPVQTATGIEEFESYVAMVELHGYEVPAIVMPSSVPIMGYELLQILRYKVNPVTEEIEPVPQNESSPPFML